MLVSLNCKILFTVLCKLVCSDLCSRNLRRVYFLVLVALLSYWLLSAVQQARSGLEVVMIVVVSYSMIFTRTSVAADCILWMLRVVPSLSSL